MSIALIVLLPLLGALLAPVTIRWGRNACAATAGAASLGSFALLMSHLPGVYAGEVLRQELPWIPQLGLSFSFFVDGLGFFFAGLILGIGLLIILYARYYLARQDPMGRFYAYLLLFQSAMLGIALSDNALLFLVFWEMTSLSSFLLIGYWRHLPEGRQGARMALAVTGGGGLALIGGMLLLGEAAGTYAISEIITRGEVIQAHPLYVPALLLILVGAFTKSAQFPFHFWLPHAMAAPTPVSAYLHSATMVKAGVFLLARFWPALAGTDIWFLIVTPVGLATMAIAAFIAIFKNDLKALLAFSTVSHLGMMTMLLGFGTEIGVVVAMFHILNHATFKAALFMSAGIVDHEAGTRDIRKLGGLAKLMPISSVLALIAAASMAGLPFFNGFLSKEMMLEEAAHTELTGIPYLVPALATLAAMFSVAYSLRLAWFTYMGPVRQSYPHHPHDPPVGMWAPVALLVVLVVAIGLVPPIAGPIVARTSMAVLQTDTLPYYSLAIWHGLTPALFMSIAAIVVGTIVVALYRSLSAAHAGLPHPDAKSMFDRTIAGLVSTARGFTGATQTGSLQLYAGIIVASIVAVGAVAFLQGGHAPGTRATLPASPPAIVAWAVLVAVCGAVVVAHTSRLLTLVLTSVVGLVVSVAFLQFSAPDLALTQISVEVVTTILLLLALNLLPRQGAPERSNANRFGSAAIAITAGLGVAALAYAVMTRDVASISEYHIAQSKPGGGGTNIVNVILVDFRGTDTFGEIIVLGIAALAIFAMLDSALRGASARRLAAMLPTRKSGDAHPMPLVVATRVILPLAITVGIFIFLRGHNEPGGGFIAGLVVAIALIMQYIASGFDWASARARYNPHAMIGAGVIIAGLTGVASFLFGAPFLTSSYDYFHIPLVGEVELATAMAFDLGVFLTVVGTVLLALFQISRVEHKAERVPVPEGPYEPPFHDAARGSGRAMAAPRVVEPARDKEA
ncbi:monovalent cation/H+ antiporter subunit A [Salinarimonas ramus]|uniref:Monovalent cation/H+ antiporter subunit A n=1 Tax=Salinarimonas ramus TaxID=690164 RepID=A0A917QDP1_9HYPH|nr:monovalent cation/H+ antiporter subunit A [Salinarimonas ramus]GGK45420.1 monovalent cation/H+ antiporter subunit A [Salinarimonas ramus]